MPGIANLTLISLEIIISYIYKIMKFLTPVLFGKLNIIRLHTKNKKVIFLSNFYDIYLIFLGSLGNILLQRS